jgi:hypothetical protein
MITSVAYVMLSIGVFTTSVIILATLGALYCWVEDLASRTFVRNTTNALRERISELERKVVQLDLEQLKQTPFLKKGKKK